MTRIICSPLRIFGILLAFCTFTFGNGEYRSRIPNGFSVPCVSGECIGVCAGVGHVNINDGTMGCTGGQHPIHDNNQFGTDLRDYGNFDWNKDVCMRDSDGDGFSNGDELGDPCCVWTDGATPTRTGRTSLSHPGSPKSKLSVSSCIFGGAPNILMSSDQTTVSTSTLSMSTNSCICSFAAEVSLNRSTLNFLPTKLSYNATNFVVSGLEQSSDYIIRIYALNLAGNSTSTYSISTPAVSPSAPMPPTQLTLTSSGTAYLILSWPSVSSATSYELDMRSSSDPLFTTVYTGSELSATITQLSPGVSYVFRARSSNAYGPGNSSSTFMFITTPSSGPTTTGSSGGNNVPQTDPESFSPQNYTALIQPFVSPIAGVNQTFSFIMDDPMPMPVTWSALYNIHGKRLHAYFISGDFSIFGHVSPDDYIVYRDQVPTITFDIPFIFPTSGQYYILLDFVTKFMYLDGTFAPTPSQIYITIPISVMSNPNETLPSVGAPSWDAVESKTQVQLIGGYPWELLSGLAITDRFVSGINYTSGSDYKVTMTIQGNGTVYSGENQCTNLAFTFEDKNGSPLTNMMPFQNTPISLLIVHESYNYTEHTYANPVSSLSATQECSLFNYSIIYTGQNLGNVFSAGVMLPWEGRYRVFVQGNLNNQNNLVASFQLNALPDPLKLKNLTASPVQQGDYPFSIEFLGGDITMYWAIEAGNVINIALVASGNGWVGIGFDPDDDGMTNADMIIGYVQNKRVWVLDSWSTGEVTPTEDIFQIDENGLSGLSSITESAGFKDASSTTIKFRRHLDTHDTFDKAITNRTMKVVYAYNPSTTQLSDHGPINRGVVQINFFTGFVDETILGNKDELQLAHSTLMTIGWLFFVTVGIFSARFGHAYRAWFPFHIVVMTAGLILVFAGFVIGIVLSENDFKQSDSLILAHAWIGLFVVIGGLIQPIIGIIADRMYDPNRASVPIWPDKIHWLVGRYSYAGAILNILLGMLYLQVQLVYYILFAIWVLIVIVSYHVLDLKWKKAQ